MADTETELVQTLPVLPLKNSVLFPHLLMPLAVGRPGSLAAAEAALSTEGKEIIVVAQRDPNKDAATAEDLYTVGTRAVIKKMARPSDSQMDLIVLGVERVVILELEQHEPFLRAQVRAFPLPDESSQEVQALHRAVAELAARVLQLAQPNALTELGQLLASPPPRSAWSTCWPP